MTIEKLHKEMTREVELMLACITQLRKIVRYEEMSGRAPPFKMIKQASKALKELDEHLDILDSDQPQYDPPDQYPSRPPDGRDEHDVTL